MIKPANIAKEWQPHVEEAMAQGKLLSCILCGCEPNLIGLFIPENPGNWGALPGKSRLFFYAVCGHCLQQEGAQEAIEQIIMVFVFPRISAN